MKNLNEINGRDLKRLSAYLDGELSSKEATRLEARLKAEPNLQEALTELKSTSMLLASLPQVRPPRNFTLTPEMVGVQKKRSMYPVFQFATVVASVAFVVLIGADAFFLGDQNILTDTLSASAPEVVLDQEPGRAFEVQEAPVEKPMAIEALITPTEEVVAETIIEGEADRSSPDAPYGAGTDETQESGLEKSEDLQTDQPQNDMIIPPEGISLATEEPMQDGMADPMEQIVPTLTQVPVPEPTATEIPIIEIDDDEPSPQVEPLHVAEAGLGITALLLAGITFFLRRKR